jgi:outer membrane protein insertion porin family
MKTIILRSVMITVLGAWPAGTSVGQRIADLPAPDLIVGRTEIRGNRAISTAYLVERLATKPGDRLDSAALARDLSAISLAYAMNGYPHASAVAAEFRLESDMVHRVIAVDEGPRVTVTGIRFVGNAVTRGNVMARMSQLAVPTTFDSRKVSQAIKRLEKSGLFAEVGTPYLAATSQGPGNEVLVCPVKEMPYHSLYGAMGYSQPEGSDKGWLAGALSISLANIAGTARSFELKWQRPRRDNSRLEMKYREPWILGFPVSSELEASHRVEDSSYVQTRAGALLVISLGDNLNAGFGGSLDRVVPGQAQQVGRSLKYSSLWQLSVDFRESGPSTEGLWASTRLEYGRKRYPQSNVQHTVARIWGDGGLLLKARPKVLAYGGFHGRAAVSGEKPVPRPDQFAMGGAGSLRGYFEDQFLADQVAWSSIELRLIADRALAFHTFWDAGYYWDGFRGQRGIRHGLGFGFRLATRIGRVEVDYGLGRDDGPLDGKIHLLAGSDF